jgi:hypothetical protein
MSGQFTVAGIDTDGRVVTELAARPERTAAAFIGTEHLSVVTCHHPALAGTHVLYVDDFGLTLGRPLNRKAWALYGGSPIYGPAVLLRDDHDDLDPDILEALAAEFPDPEISAQMDAWLAKHGGAS